MLRILELRRQLEALSVEGRALLALSKKEERKLTEEEEKRYDEIEKEIVDKRADLKHEERSHFLTIVSESVTNVPTETVPVAIRTEIVPTEQRRLAQPGQAPAVVAAEQEEFTRSGDFLYAMRFERNCERMREHVRRYQERAFSMGVGAEGGIFVAPEVMTAELLKLSSEMGIVRSRARIIGPGASPDASLSIPAMVQGSNGAEGGAVVVWTGEGATMSETDAEIEDVTFEPKEVTAYSTVTDKLLRNAPSAGSFIMDILGGAMASAEDYAMLRGDGVGKPLGIIKTPGRLLVTRNTSSKWLYEDILNMEAALYAVSQDSAVWVGSRSGFVQAKDLRDSSGNRIYTDVNIVKGFPAMLDGLPFIWTGRLPVLGSEGDLALLDFSKYIIKDGVGPLISMSEHSEFKANKTVIKIVKSVDGQGWVREPLTLEDGVTEASPYIVLK